VRLETERLVLRRWRPEDLEPLAAILLHPAVLAWVGPPGAGRDDVAGAIDRYERHWETYGFGRLAVVDKLTRKLVGRTGVMRQPAWTATACKDEIGWAIDPSRWGEGMATEAACEALRDVFERVRLPQVIGFALPENSGSLRVMAKLGFEPGGSAEWDGTPHVWSSITAGDLAQSLSVRGA
jgi:RimJ/RimL family protein N-acetyltransferase